MIHNMIHNIKLIAVLALITFGAGQAWARGGGNIKTGTVTGGTLTFYKTYESGTLSDEIGKNGIEAEANKPVYIKATPDGIHTGVDVEFNIQESTSTSNAQTRTLTRSGATDPGVGRTIEVSDVADAPGIYSFTMPTSGNNVLVEATFAAKPYLGDGTHDHIDYLIWDDTDKALESVNTGNGDHATVYVLDGTEEELGVSDQTTWYVCNSTLAYNHTLKTLGNVNIIISGSLTIGTANSPVSSQGFNAKNNLCLYGHASATGTNSVTINSELAAIYSMYGAVTITNCATVEVTSSGADGIYAQKDLTITGGQVTVTGANSKDGLISDENIILGWTKASDYIKASSYSIPSGKSVKTADGQRFVAYNMASEGDISATAIVSDTYYTRSSDVDTDDKLKAALAGINGKTLKPLGGYIVTVADGISLMDGTTDKAADFTITTGEGTEAVTTPYYIYKASTEEAPVSVTLSYGGSNFIMLNGVPEGTTLNAVENQPMQRNFAMPAADVALTATAVTDLTASSTITYSGSAQTPAILLDESAFETTNYIVTDITPKEGSTLTEGKAVNAGSYTITVTGLGQYIGTASVDFTIGKADYDGTTTVSTYVRSGQATTGKTLTLPALPEGASYASTGTVGGTNDALIDVSDGTPTVSGTTLTFSTTYQDDGASATITIPVTGATNFNDYSVVVTVTAKDKDEAGVTINGGEDKIVTYGANDFTLVKAVTGEGTGTRVWTWTSTNTDVATIGENTGTITIKKAGNTTIRAQYESNTTMGEASIELTVDPKPLVITWNTDGLVYNGTPQAPTATLSGVKSGDDCTVSISVEGAHTLAGTDYTATAALSGFAAGNYTLPKDKKSQIFSIAPKPVTVTGITANDKEYDGNINVTLNTANASIEGKVGEEDVTVDVSAASGTVADKNVGTNKAVTVTGVALGGMDAGNYTLSTQPTGVTSSITKKTVTVSGITASNKAYDGKTMATLNYNSTTISGKVTGDKLSVSATGAFADKNAGNNKTVNISNITLTGSDKGNYTLATTGATTTANISKKALTVTADDKSVSYGDAAPTYTASYSGFVSGESKSNLSGSLSFTCSYTSSSNTGDYTITPSGLTSSNYSITYKEGTLTVEASIVESESGTTVTLDENGYSVTVSEGNGSGGVINIPDGGSSINVASLTYNRTLDAPTESNRDVTIDGQAAKLYTTCLPTTPTTNTNVKYYKLASVSNNTLNFTEEISPAANTPYLMAVTGSNDIPEQVTGSNVTLKKIVTGTPVDGYTMMGTHTGLSNANAISAAGGTENDTYILQDQSKWGKVVSGTVYIPPFRAFIVGPATSAGARELDSSFDGETVGIDTLRLTDADGTEQWYDLNGRRIEKPTRKGIYIHNGKVTTKK